MGLSWLGEEGANPPPFPYVRARGVATQKSGGWEGKLLTIIRQKIARHRRKFFWHVIEIIGRKSLELTIIRPKFFNISVVLKKKAP